MANSTNRKKIETRPEWAEQITKLAGFGMRDDDICKVYNMSEKSLKRHYHEELAAGRITAKHEVIKRAYEMASSGQHPTLTIFWLKTQCRWKEANDTDAKIIELDNRLKETKELLAGLKDLYAKR